MVLDADEVFMGFDKSLETIYYFLVP